MRKISITIDPVGRPTVEAIGFNGVGCEEATKHYEDALGGKIVDRTFKPEYSNTEVEEVKATW